MSRNRRARGLARAYEGQRLAIYGAERHRATKIRLWVDISSSLVYHKIAMRAGGSEQLQNPRRGFHNKSQSHGHGEREGESVLCCFILAGGQAGGVWRCGRVAAMDLKRETGPISEQSARVCYCLIINHDEAFSPQS